MRLVTEPPVLLPALLDELELVIRIEEDETPQTYVREGSPKPDRHLLLGIVQSVKVAVEERDPDMVWFTPRCTVSVEGSGDTKTFDSGLILARDSKGAIGALVIGDPTAGRKLARQGLRWFTGTIRLDVP
jgi:hypothetical protein